jgi:hypothetical protein
MNDEAKITIETEMFNQDIVFVKGINLDQVIHLAKKISKLNQNTEFKKYGPTKENDVWNIQFYFVRGTGILPLEKTE